MTVADNTLQILLVEDNLTDVLLLEEALAELPTVEFALTHVVRLDEALTYLREGNFDAVLLDLGLPDSQGIETFNRMQSQNTEVPILVLSGLDDEALSVHAVQQGAQDYLLKGKINSSMLRRTIRYSIERKRVEQRLIASEISHRRLFEAALDGIFILDGDTGQITDANPALEQMLGYSLTEMLGKRLWEVPSFREKEASHAAFSTLSETGGRRYEDLPLATKDGVFVDVEFVSSVYLVKNKKVIQCNIRDISERKRAEEERDRFFTLSLDIMCVIDPSGHFVRLNPAFAALLGFNNTELMAKPFIEFVHPDDVPATLWEVEKLATGVPTLAFENRYLCRDGSYKWLKWAAAPKNGYMYCAAHD
nr:PAS domain S-box protein [Armatimonadota bacterium]